MEGYLEKIRHLRTELENKEKQAKELETAIERLSEEKKEMESKNTAMQKIAAFLEFQTEPKRLDLTALKKEFDLYEASYSGSIRTVSHYSDSKAERLIQEMKKEIRDQGRILNRTEQLQGQVMEGAYRNENGDQ